MKKCPYCKADIEDNARFCLYCMKPLNEKEVIPPPQRKKQWWPLVVAAALLIALLILLISRGNADLPSEPTGKKSTSTGQTTDSQASENTDENTQDTQNEGGESQGDTILEENQNATGTPGTNQEPTQNQNSDTQKPTENTTPTTKPTQPETPTQNTTPPTEDSDPTEETTVETTLPTTTPTTPEETTPEETVPEETVPEETVPEETVPEETVPEETVPEETVPEETQPQVSTEPEAPKTDVIYTYREARAGDDFNAQYQNTGSDIVITGITQPSDDGIYDIPSSIDGKKVIAIVANAFSGSNAKVVYIPATVKTIWNHAFAGCGLTDIYFRGNAIYTESKAFDRSITIHCSAACSDRNFRYYKNSAANYGATWSEWNG